MRRDRWLCQPCRSKGKITPATECDHVLPKASGGTDDLDNVQAICTPCHKLKTEAEAAAAQGRRFKQRLQFDEKGWPIWPQEPLKRTYSIPQGIQPASCRVVVVFGRPGAGKTTYVKARAAKGDAIIDLDEIKVAIGGKLWDTDPIITRDAIRRRNVALLSLACKTPTSTTWLIVTGPTAAERAAWLDALGPMAEPVVIDTPATVCIDRIKAEPLRRWAADKQIEAVKAWSRY